jgi:CheY-like chemotaxis protein
MKLIRSTLPSTIRVRTDFKDGNDFVLADPTQIHQVLVNLCTNAAYAMRKEGGILSIRLSRVDIEPDKAGFYPAMKAGRHLKLEVSDTGQGIDPAIQDRIFDPFFTTKGPGEGTGLGLSVVYGIARHHNGAITMDSKLNGGSTFTLYLPLIDECREPIVQRMTDQLVGWEKILLVDDEESIVSAEMEFLASLGYDVTVRYGSLDALEAFRADPDGFDLVITDMTMPVMTGAKLAVEMLKLRPELPIILATGYSALIDEEGAKKIGIAEFMMKPVSLDQLAITMRRILDCRLPNPENTLAESIDMS